MLDISFKLLYCRSIKIFIGYHIYSSKEVGRITGNVDQGLPAVSD